MGAFSGVENSADAHEKRAAVIIGETNDAREHGKRGRAGTKGDE